MKIEILINQMKTAREYVIDNAERLFKIFGSKFIAVEYRDRRKGIVVDSDMHREALYNRVERYGHLIIGTITEIIQDRKESIFDSPEPGEVAA